MIIIELFMELFNEYFYRLLITFIQVNKQFDRHHRNSFQSKAIFSFSFFFLLLKRTDFEFDFC